MALPSGLTNGTGSTTHSNGILVPKTRGLKVIIVGGGIGGLSAAIALRNQGHHVEVYEQSRFANEVGAAIHMVPNAGGALEYLRVNPRDSGAVKLELSRSLSAMNEILRVVPNKESYRWQNEWLLAHRAHLHAQLKEEAVKPGPAGNPVQLITSARVASVDAQTATITLADGSTRTADVLIGADGINSKTRAALGYPEIVPKPGKHNAFRFTILRDIVLADPDTAPLANIDGAMDLWYSHDRKIVLYPTTYNKILNFVCIHPTELSETSDDYQKSASVDKLLEVFAGFHPSVVKLLSKADPSELKVFPLYDMDTLPTYVSGRLALIGDAAHPFTPHIAQGGAMAIEDGVSIGVMLDRDVTPQEVPERLQLYNQARHERSSTIQEYSRIVGGDGTSNSSGGAAKLKVHEYIEYGFSHNEAHASMQLLREHKWKKASPRWRQPTVFGPLPGPRQDATGRSFANFLGQSTSMKTTIKFKTSATVLRNLFPNDHYSFVKRDTAVFASFSIESFRNLAWLGGGGYELLALYIHGVQCRDSHDQLRKGDYLPVMFENLADAIITGREELGISKLFSDIHISGIKSSSQTVSMSWRGFQWATFELNDLQGLERQQQQPVTKGDKGLAETSQTDDAEGLLVHKYIPSTGAAAAAKADADADYDVLILKDPAASKIQAVSVARPSNVSVKLTDLGSQKLPTLHPVVERLAEIPIFEIVEAKVTEYQGVTDLSNVERLN